MNDEFDDMDMPASPADIAQCNLEHAQRWLSLLEGHISDLNKNGFDPCKDILDARDIAKKHLACAIAEHLEICSHE